MRRKEVTPRRTSAIPCFGLVLFIATVSWQSNSSLAFSVCDSSAKIQASSLCASQRIAPTQSSRLTLRTSKSSSNNEDESLHECHTKRRVSRRKHALLRKYGRAVALSTTLLYGPMATIPSARRVLRGSTAHAASTVPKSLTSGSDYNFQDFKDVKKKLSLAPGANVEAYEEILAKIEVEGEAALEDQKDGAALTIGESSGEEGEKGPLTAGDSETKAGRRASKKAEKRRRKKAQDVSEWESDEFGFGEVNGDEDFDSNVLSFGGSTATSTKLSSSKKSKSAEASSGKGGGGDVVLTDKMAYNNYKASLSQEEKASLIKKGAFYSLFPVFIITTIRGQFKAWKERKWVKKGLAIKEEERQKYLEEKKKKKEGNSDDDDDDDDDDEDDDDD